MKVLPFGDAAALAPPHTLRKDLPGGGLILRNPQPLQPHARCVGEWLEHWSATTPDALFLSERRPDGLWRRLSYAEARIDVGRIAQALLDMELPAGKPIVVLSDNAIDHALLALAAMHVGRAVCIVSSAYCRLTKDYRKISGILDMLDPALVYAADPALYGPAISAWVQASGTKTPIAFSQDAESFRSAGRSGIAFSALLAVAETPQVRQVYAGITPDSHAKYLLTSGSTGTPKVAVNTHRMLTANQQQIAQAWPFLTRHKLVLLDWLPWSHTFGANHNFNMVLAHGGSLAIDEGRPAPALIDKTVRNLREVRPNFHFNVPRGFEMLLGALEADDALAKEVFERLEGVFYAGAALPQSLWRRLERVAAKVRTRPIWFTSAWGSTETSPAVTSVHWPIDRAGCIGLPLAGAEIKFVPNGGKLEMRVRGPNVFPGYRNAPDLTAKAFDEDGWYLIGDAGRLVNEADASAGVAFDGRVAEDFKLTTGTWVSVGTLRLRAVTAFTPLASDVVVTGHDRAEVGLLVFPSPQAAGMTPHEVAQALRRGLQKLRNDTSGSSSQAPTRALMLAEPPSADAGEITDKGYINQRAVLTRRAAEVEVLYAGGASVVRLDS